MIYALGWMVMLSSWWFPPLFLVTIPFALCPVLLPAIRLLINPQSRLGVRRDLQALAGQVACIWVSTVTVTATPRDSNEILVVALLAYLLAGLCSAWGVLVPLERLPSAKALLICGLASQSLWLVFGHNVIDNLNGLFS